MLRREWLQVLEGFIFQTKKMLFHQDGKSWENERKGQILTDFQAGWIQIIKTMFQVFLYVNLLYKYFHI